MAYRVEILPRARKDLDTIFDNIGADDSIAAMNWFNGLVSAIRSLDSIPARAAITPEDGRLRHLLYSGSHSVYRIIYKIDESKKLVSVIHIRHGSRRPLQRHSMGRQVQ